MTTLPSTFYLVRRKGAGDDAWEVVTDADHLPTGAVELSYFEVEKCCSAAKLSNAHDQVDTLTEELAGAEKRIDVLRGALRLIQLKMGWKRPDSWKTIEAKAIATAALEHSDV